MRRIIFVLAIFCAAQFARAQGGSAIASAQQVLKDQGFYYGEITGKKDADTIAAVRRYQIRNGLQVTGELNAETQNSLGVKGSAAPPPVARATPTPLPRVTTTPPPETRDLRDENPPQTYEEPQPQIATTDIFRGTPYENASPDVQRRLIMNAQNLLTRRGYLHTPIDGEFGADTEFALRAYQARFRIASSGRLDRETLAAMGLMPGQRMPGVTAGVAAPRSRIYRRPPMVTPEGEPIYQGR